MGNFFLHLIIFLPFLILINCNNHSETPSPSLIPPLIPDLLNFIDQRLALVYPIIQTFKNTITSDPLGITATWVGGDVCNYKGFYCDHPPDNATATALASVDFNGFLLGAPSIDGFIEKLPDLAVFHANTNFFSGTISPKIAELPYLYELDISNNKFSGEFPVAVLHMIRLTFLDIRFNLFTGSVPSQIFTKTLDALFVNNNNFLQNLPETLGSTPAVYLTLANNKFTGPIPRSIGKASDTLTEVLFLNNLLTGCLPHEIGFLRQATVFDAGNNLLTGPLPCSFGCLEKIEQLSFAGNLLYGQVPEVVCSLRNLENLTLSNNYFTQIGPVCRKLVKSGVLDVRKNCIHKLSGQRSIEECALFFLHPRTCRFPETFKIMSCKVSTTSHRSPGRSKRLPVSYAALSRHKLR